MGIVLNQQGKLEESIDAYNKALSLKPNYAKAYNNMAITLQDQGKHEEAIEAYNKAIEGFSKDISIKPDYAEAYRNLGIALKDQGKLEEAIEAFNKAISIKPDYATAKHMLSALTGNTNETAPREYVENYLMTMQKNLKSPL